MAEFLVRILLVAEFPVGLFLMTEFFAELFLMVVGACAALYYC